MPADAIDPAERWTASRHAGAGRSPLTAMDTAAVLASQGLPVFPCLENKAPACKHGFKDAVREPAAVRHLWRRYPGPLIGVPTGPASGFDALDIDPRHGGQVWWQANIHRLPETRLHRTGSGGLHVLFRYGEAVRNTESKLAPGVDTRGTGGYIVWWPSIGCRVQEAPLAEWPAWLLDRLLRKPRPRDSAQRLTPIQGGDAAQRVARRVLNRLEDAAEGERHYALRKAAYTLGGLIDALPFGENEAVKRLVEAVEKAGAADLENARRTALWGLARGRAKPFQVEARP